MGRGVENLEGLDLHGGRAHAPEIAHAGQHLQRETHVP